MANRAWLYCRIDSGHEHEAKKLLDNQEQRLLDYCAQQGLVDIYADGPVKIGLNQKHPTARGALV